MENEHVAKKGFDDCKLDFDADNIYKIPIPRACIEGMRYIYIDNEKNNCEQITEWLSSNGYKVVMELRKNNPNISGLVIAVSDQETHKITDLIYPGDFIIGIRLTESKGKFAFISTVSEDKFNTIFGRL